MARRALLIASQTYGLTGCDADAALMRGYLERRGFEAIDVRTGADATRAGILDGLDDLAAAVSPDDTVLVYYSGHGGRLARPDFEDRKVAGLPVHYQFIVPFDMDDSAPGDFRGLLSEELTDAQRRLTDAFRSRGAVPNVTTILDCCHSGYLARGHETVPKRVDAEARSFRIRGIREHADGVASRVMAAGHATNPDAVRLVACQPEQSAFERPSERGGRHGALTDALVTVLDGLGPAPVSWRVVGELVRRRVRSLVPEQRPDFEGPAHRVLFGTDLLANAESFAVAIDGDVVSIEAAPIVGISIGDEFRLVSAGHDDEVGVATVSHLAGSAAVLELSPALSIDALGADVIAIPTRISIPRVQVAIDVPGGAPALRDRLDDNERVDVGTDPASSIAIVTASSGGLSLADREGESWRTETFTDDAAGHDRIEREIEAIAIGHRLLDLAAGADAHTLDAVVTVEFGEVVDGARRALALHGERIGVGRPVYLTVVNGSAEPLFAWVFDVGVAGRSALLTNAAPSGTRLGPAGAEDDRLELWGPAGECVVWPADVPTSVTTGVAPGRWETFVVLTADQRGDLSSLATPAMTTRGLDPSPIAAIMREARTGVREIAAATAAAAPLRYRFDTVEFLLQPG